MGNNKTFHVLEGEEMIAKKSLVNDKMSAFSSKKSLVNEKKGSLCDAQIDLLSA